MRGALALLPSAFVLCAVRTADLRLPGRTPSIWAVRRPARRTAREAAWATLKDERSQVQSSQRGKNPTLEEDAPLEGALILFSTACGRRRRWARDRLRGGEGELDKPARARRGVCACASAAASTQSHSPTPLPLRISTAGLPHLHAGYQRLRPPARPEPRSARPLRLLAQYPAQEARRGGRSAGSGRRWHGCEGGEARLQLRTAQTLHGDRGACGGDEVARHAYGHGRGTDGVGGEDDRAGVESGRRGYGGVEGGIRGGVPARARGSGAEAGTDADADTGAVSAGAGAWARGVSDTSLLWGPAKRARGSAGRMAGGTRGRHGRGPRASGTCPRPRLRRVRRRTPYPAAGAAIPVRGRGVDADTLNRGLEARRDCVQVDVTGGHARDRDKADPSGDGVKHESEGEE
ncbi:hypothetical protein FB451DRAFT_1375608 [Mycena latifolia]|nr:hypothetical protein FB451DRAFT_1375608 [Mycena latifolia]